MSESLKYMRIETKRFIIRKMRESDAEALFAIFSDEETMRFIEPVFTYEKTKEFIKEAGLCEEPLVWALEEKKTGRVIGQIIFHKYDDKRYEIGWIINKVFWHLGIADEVTKALIDFANENNINRLIIECAGAQEITKHIAKKNGFNMISEGEIFVFERLCS